MDVSEKTKNTGRHPWEISKAYALRHIISSELNFGNPIHILDVGCGDAYIVSNIMEGGKIAEVDAVDINLSEIQKSHFSTKHNFSFHNSYDELKKKNYDLILMLDVLEHVQDDKQFLSDIANNYLTEDGFLLITVPAFNFLFSSHDRFLRHYRRYSGTELGRLINQSGIILISSGYLFLSLVFLRLLSCAYERLSINKRFKNTGVGDWRYGSVITKTLASILSLENLLLIQLSKFGFHLPGLTVWAICKKRQ